MRHALALLLAFVSRRSAVVMPAHLCRLSPCRWMAPEVIEHNPYKEKADVFRCGVGSRIQ